jgi:hypothetical protein
MAENSISIRNCFLFDASGKLTQQKYILDIMKSRLFYLSPVGMNLDEIYDYLKTSVRIEFTYDEILDAIASEKGINIELRNNVYSLTSKGFNEVIKAKNENKLSTFIKIFITDNKITEMDSEAIRELILQFIYERFNQNISSLYQIINYKVDFEQCNNSYNEQEKIIINNFLNWNNEEKNKCIYNIISKAYDYCCMTTNNYNNCEINLSEWNFYFCANVFFRLAGFNSRPDRDLLHRFVEIARQLNLHLKFTNFTKDEIFSAIDRRINFIRQICGDYALISPDEFINYTSPDISLEFYRIFYKWCKDNGSVNYELFSAYIYNKINKLLAEFEEDNNGVAYDFERKGYARNLFDSMKSNLPKKPEKALKADLNNILFLKDKMKENTVEKYCLITIDSGVVNWTYKTFVGLTLVEQPSVWLGILLKYYGRTTHKDYEAFCNFISLPVYIRNEVDLSERLGILACVQACINDAGLKDKALRELNTNHSLYEKYASPEKKVEAAVDNVIENEIEELKRSVEEKYIREIELINQEHELKYCSLQTVYDEMAIRYNEVERKYGELLKRFTDFEKKDNDNNEIKLETVVILAKEKINIQLVIYRVLFGISLLCSIGTLSIITYLVIQAFQKELWQPLQLILTSFFTVLFFIIDPILYNGIFCKFCEEKIIGRNIKKIGIKSNLPREILNKYCKENGYE